MEPVACAPQQRSLFADRPLAVDTTFALSVRHPLDATAWVDVCPGWLAGADEAFDALLAGVGWEHHVMRMYDRMVDQPRLSAHWDLDGEPPPLPVLGAAAAALADRYGHPFPRVGANLYRDGADSVAWHGDRVARERPEAVIAVLTLGSARPFRLRPTGGGPGVGFRPGPGDLLVMGGSCQRTWQHSVPKVRGGGPRISVTFRHLDG